MLQVALAAQGDIVADGAAQVFPGVQVSSKLIVNLEYSLCWHVAKVSPHTHTRTQFKETGRGELTQARLEAAVQAHASMRRPARATRRSLREVPAGGTAVRFQRTGTLSPPSLHGLAMRRG